MDDNLLAEQYDKTGNLMDWCDTEAWLKSIEADGNEPIEAGLPMKAYQAQLNALTQTQMQQIRDQMKVQSVLFPALHDWMSTWDLGAGFEDTYAIARRLIRQHLGAPTPALQQFIDQIIDQTSAENAQPNCALNSPQVIELLSAVFTPEDWQVMAQAAAQSISAQVLQAGQTQPKTAAA
ncbi:MAG: hypothetical protein MUF49_27050 [Oculatellaceae cyanobacterium Prado106]|jgi:hypothetical protein|nr:hypothetical protein [Oculatellaceae cyanobacterium Prado106]